MNVLYIFRKQTLLLWLELRMETETHRKVKRANYVSLTGINIIGKNNTMPYVCWII